uniref:Elongator complex protein 2 n=1 Tax=Ditylenchus dipsaci TaxID=166011 RepID=A0A915D517_9BILA
MEQLDSIFTAAGCACRPNVLDWCSNTDFICFAISLDIAASHSAEITSLKFVTEPKKDKTLNGTGLLVTGSSNGELCLWKLDQNSSPRISLITKYEKLADSLPVTLARGYFWDANTLDGILLSAHCDSIHFNFPTFQEGEIPLQPIRFGSSLVLSYDLLCAPKVLLLAVGLSNGYVELYFTDKCCSSDFVKGVSLIQAHSGWIRDVAFRSTLESADESCRIYLATSSDTLIRIWSLVSTSTTDPTEQIDDGELKLKPLLLKITSSFNKVNISFEVKLDSVLVLQLVSSSMDKNVVIWEPSSQHQDSIWVPAKRIGEVGGEAVGFYDAIFSPDGSKVLYHSFFGALLMWQVEEEASQVEFTIGGHFGSVTDLDWEKSGSYLVTCSLDKTTRIFSQLKESQDFVEVARPQLHGHSLNCLASVSSNFFVSGGEEKIFRVFQTTFSFVETMRQLCGVSVEMWNDCNSVYAASQPELGFLEKKCVFTVAPTDEQLSTSTLFPEIHKLYGHGFEVFAVSANHKGTLLATGCKASHAEHATIMIWSTVDWQRKSILSAHQLTITQMCFSPNDQYLLSVSRDRTWNLFGQTTDSENDFVIVSSGDKRTSGHSRIIWTAAWSHDSSYFATASRDKILNVWRLLNEDLYFLAAGLDNGQIVLLKWNSDNISSTSGFHVIREMNQNEAFCGNVSRIHFRPVTIKSQEKEEHNSGHAVEFAACSSTHIVKVYRFTC